MRACELLVCCLLRLSLKQRWEVVFIAGEKKVALERVWGLVV